MENIPLQFYEHLVWDCGFPHPDWERIRASGPESTASVNPHAFYSAQERQWLGVLRDHLGGRYAVRESDRVFLLSEQSDEDAKETLRFIHTAINEIKDALEALAGTDSLGKHVLIVFTEDDDYYDYISHFFPDGYFGLTGGVCIKEHEVHIVVNGLNDSTRGTIAHELAHDLLYPRQPPLWLEEGVVQVVSKLVMKEDALPWTPERRLVHQQHWSWHGLESFWGGASFSRQDDLQQLSYELAEALVRRANADNPERFNGMLRDAVPEDGGEKACVEYLGMSLVHYIRQLLGDGPWYPPRRVND